MLAVDGEGLMISTVSSPSPFTTQIGFLKIALKFNNAINIPGWREAS